MSAHAASERVVTEVALRLAEVLQTEYEPERDHVDEALLRKPLRLEERLVDIEREPGMTTLQVTPDDVRVVDRDIAPASNSRRPQRWDRERPG